MTKTTNKNLKTYAWTFAALALSPSAAFARGDAASEILDLIVELLTSTWARSAALIALAFLGYQAWTGKIELQRVMYIVAGFVLVFGGASIVDMLVDASA